MERRVFKQGERVTWRDGSGERQHGLVLSHSPPRIEPDGTEREEVLVMRDGSSHVSVLPPEALVPTEP